MAFSTPIARGSAVSILVDNTISMNPSAALAVGRFIVVGCSTANIQTTDGASNNHSTVADSKNNVWTKHEERTETAGAVADGTTVSIWSTRVTTQIETTDTITLTTSGTIDDKIITATEVQCAANMKVELAQVGLGPNAIQATVSGLPSKEYFLIGVFGAEGSDNAKTPDADYTERHDLRSRNSAAATTIHVQTRIATLTTDTCTSTGWTNTDPYALLAAFFEAPLIDVPAGALTLSGLAPTLFFTTFITAGVGALAFGGLAPSVDVTAPQNIAIPAGALAYTGTNIKVAFQGPETGAIRFQGLAPTALVEDSNKVIAVPAGSLSLAGGVVKPSIPINLEGIAEWWDLDEASGSAVGEYNGITLTEQGGTIGTGTLAGLPARDFEDTDSRHLQVSDNDTLSMPSDTPFTIALRVQWESLAAGGGVENVLIAKDNGSSGSVEYAILWGPTSTIRISIGTSGGVVHAVGSFLPTVGTPYTIVAKHDPANTRLSLKINDVVVINETNYTDGIVDGPGAFKIGSGRDLVGDYHDGLIRSVGIFKRVWSEAEDTFFHNQGNGVQYSDFAQPNTVIPIPAGVLRLTGLDPTVSVSGGTETNIPVPVGSEVFTGLAPTLQYAFTTAIPAGSVVLSGQAPTISIGLAQPIPAGAVAFSGLAPFISTGVNPAVPAGSLVLQGQAPIASIGFTLPIPAGSELFTGLAPTLSTGVVRELSAGSLAFSGLAPAVTYQISIAIPAGALTYEGRTPNIGGGLIIDPGKGALSFAGLAPTLFQTFVYAIPSGSLAWQGLASSLAFTIPLQAGALNLTGFAPTVVPDRTIAIGAGALTFTGQAPNLFTEVFVQPPAGSLVLTGLAPSIGIDYVFDLPAGSLVWQGLAPSLVIAPTVVLRAEDADLRVLPPRHTMRVLAPRNTMRVLNPRNTIREL